MNRIYNVNISWKRAFITTLYVGSFILFFFYLILWKSSGLRALSLQMYRHQMFLGEEWRSINVTDARFPPPISPNGGRSAVLSEVVWGGWVGGKRKGYIGQDWGPCHHAPFHSDCNHRGPSTISGEFLSTKSQSHAFTTSCMLGIPLPCPGGFVSIATHPTAEAEGVCSRGHELSSSSYTLLLAPLGPC